MATRKIIDIEQNGEKVWPKGHAKATFMSNGTAVEDAINSIQTGSGGGAQGPQGPQGEQGPKGDDGVGIASVVQTTTSSADGGSNVMTVTLSDGTKSTFTVKNGSKGSQGEQGPKGDQGIQGEQGPKGDQGEQGIQGVQGIQGAEGPKGDKGDTGPEGPKGDKGDKGDTGATGANGTNGKDGTDGEDGATFTPSVDANGNLSWTNNKGLSNPPTVNIKGPKGDSGEGGGSSGGKKEVIVLYGSDPLVMKPDVVYWVSDTNHFTVQSFETPLAAQDTYDIFTAVLFLGIDEDSQTTITLPDYVYWANGVIPETISGYMELSISRITDGHGMEYGEESYFAVLTPFKPVE